LECIQIAHKAGSSIVSLWLADGTNYPGQDDLRSRSMRLGEGLKQVYAALPAGIRLLVEYKFFEPGFYSTDLPDWGTAYAMCLDLGPQAEVLVDTGHHAQGVNIEQIVAQLLDRARLGGFHFNARKYADDDLIVGSANRVLVEAYETDVRPILAEARKRLGIDPDPVAALRGSGYIERAGRERGKAAAGSGYQGA